VPLLKATPRIGGHSATQEPKNFTVSSDASMPGNVDDLAL